VFRDLRSTNARRFERDGKRIPIDASARWEIALADGDVLLLGNRRIPCGSRSASARRSTRSSATA